jgi:phosphate/phosphite/phosphonate ABC transporter binding protein
LEEKVKMKKLYLLVSILVLASVVLGACAPAATPTVAEATTAPTQPPATMAPEATEAMALPDLGGREITIAVENAYLPFNYVRLDTGQAEGWDYDFINEACKRLNCKPVWVEFAWDTMIASVANGQFDMATDGITITPERAQQVDFSEGYINIEQRLLVKNDEDRFQNIDEFKSDPNLLLGEQLNTTNYTAAADLVGEDRIIAFDTFGLAVQALIAGDVDGVVIDEVAGMGYIGANKDQVKLIGSSISSDQLGFIFPKGSELVDPFNKAIDAMKADGSLNQINVKYFGGSFAVSEADIGPGAYAEEGIGTEDHPIKVLFVPSVDAQQIISGGDVMAKALHDATGFFFDVSVPTSYAATIEEMCASPSDTMGFIPGLGYVLANQLCGVDVAFKAVRYGWSVYWTQFLVPRDSDIQTFEDLDGKKWGYPDAGSTSGYMVPLVMFQEAGIEPGESIETGGHNQAAKAVYDGSVDFATTFYSPPLVPEGVTPWVPGEDPDIPADLVDSCAVTEDGGALMCGDWRVLDARANIRTEAPDVIQKVRILTISPDIPNDTLSFGPEFPEDMRKEIENALVDFAKTDAWNQSIGSQDFYNWTGIDPATDDEYDFVRKMVEAVGLTLEGLGE